MAGRAGYQHGGGVDLTLALVLLGAFAFLLYGGLKAVALTDIIQVVLLVAGGLMIAVILLEKVSGVRVSTVCHPDGHRARSV